MSNKILLTDSQTDELIIKLKNRFEKNINRHPEYKWNDIQLKLKSLPNKLWSLNEMEKSEGEPDVIGYIEETDEYIFCDCSIESPKGRRGVCYDKEALESRKAHKPHNNAIEMANEMGIEILTEDQYRNLQNMGEFDTKTSSWIKTPDEVRKLGGALFCDRRFNKVFVYHNGAESYYGVRGFRGIIYV